MESGDILLFTSNFPIRSVATDIKLDMTAIYSKCTFILLEETGSVTMNIFGKKKYFLFKSFVKVELTFVFTINMEK